MFQVTEKASEMIQNALKDKEDSSYIRLFLSQGGWAGPSLAMALDEPKDDDEVFEDNGISYLIEKNLFEQAKPISVDFTDTVMGSGFFISSNIAKDTSYGGSCSC